MPNMGRKKTQMKLIEGESSRQVTFSKRRSGLFKKASELCTMCAVEVAIVIFSLGGKAFSFGYPSVHSVFNSRFGATSLDHLENPDDDAIENEVGQEPDLEDLNKMYCHVLEQVALKKKQEKTLKRTIMENPGPDWLKAPPESLSVEELRKVKGALEKAKENALKDKEELLRHISLSSAKNSPALSPLPENDPAGETSSVDSVGH